MTDTYGAWQVDLGVAASPRSFEIRVTAPSEAVELALRASDDAAFGSYDSVTTVTMASGVALYRSVGLTSAPSRRYWRLVLTDSGDELEVVDFRINATIAPTTVSMLAGDPDVYGYTPPPPEPPAYLTTTGGDRLTTAGGGAYLTTAGA